MSTSPYYDDDAVTLWHGDALEVLRGLPAGSVASCVTSPPYYGLRDYGVTGQIGLEPTVGAYVERLRELFAEVRRVLAEDGTLWLNLGDSYASKARGTDAGWDKSRLTNPGTVQKAQAAALRKTGERHRGKSEGIGEKNLIGIPWRVAFALQDDGWTLRNDIIWAKPNAMPESVTDRLNTRHEHVFLFSKRTQYWFNLDPIREPLVRPEALTEGITFGGSNPDVGRRRGSTYRPSRRDSFARATKEAQVPGQSSSQHRTDRPDVVAGTPLGRNPGDVWSIPTQPFTEAHFAVMPLALAERCILAGARPGGIVLDPFSGSGTTGLAATKHGRRYIGIDLNATYLDLSLRTRLAQGVLDTPTEATA